MSPDHLLRALEPARLSSWYAVELPARTHFAAFAFRNVLHMGNEELLSGLVR